MEKEKHNNQKSQTTNQSKPKNSYTEKLRKASRKPGDNKFSKKEGGGGAGARKGDGGGGGGGNMKDRGRGKGGEASKKSSGHNVGHGQFPDYLPPPEVIKGLKNQTLIEGVLRINPKNYEDAFISSPEVKDQDIYIKVINIIFLVYFQIQLICFIAGNYQQK